MLGDRLPETENEIIGVISDLKKWSRSLKKFEWWSLTRELLKQYLSEKQNGWLRSGRLPEISGHYQRVDCSLFQ